MAAPRMHHLSCGTMCPPAARLVNGHGRLLAAGRLVCHCFLIESGDGLVLVDTGLGTAATEPVTLPRSFRAIARPLIDPDETASAGVRALGYDPRDVRHIAVTHFDLDHAGGIADFPWATVHVHAAELEAARARASFRDRSRYLPEQWQKHERWQTYDEAGEDWFGLRRLRPLVGVDIDIALVPLFGHTRGHSGVAVRLGDRWLLHAGDAYFFHGELADPPRVPFGLGLYERLVQTARRPRLENLDRLRALHRDHGDEVGIVCAHDPVELEERRRTAAARVGAEAP